MRAPRRHPPAARSLSALLALFSAASSTSATAAAAAFSPGSSPAAFRNSAAPRASASAAASLPRRRSPSTSLRSTPFDASLYSDGDDDDDVSSVNPYASEDSGGSSPSLTQPPGTPLLLGINKYSHDTSLCASDLDTGRVLFAMSKERLGRKKHEGGNAATLVEKCLDELGLEVEDVKGVVVNNHHHRVLGGGGSGGDGGEGAATWGTEGDADHMDWEEGLGINGGAEGGYTDEENLLTGAERSEMSHHLAHAYSAAAQCPFPTGLVVVMDGMGETYRTMRSALLCGDKSYTSDLAFEGRFRCVPSDIEDRSSKSVWDWREGESVYSFTKDSDARTISVVPVFKRFVEERSPPALYNHGFENMDSAGAIYSRASSHVFGDWNACGKVMGLAPWMGHVWDDDEAGRLEAATIEKPVMWGHLYVDNSDETGFRTDVSAIKGLPHIARADPDLFDDDGNMRRRYDFDDCDGDDFVPPPPPEQTAPDDEAAKGSGAPAVIDAAVKNVRLPPRVALDAVSLSHRVQTDLEDVVLDFVRHFKAETGEKNLCLAGGVALNSVLNGRLSRELGFERVFIPPYPGDDGIAVGCCAYGLWGNAALPQTSEEKDGRVEYGKGEEERPRPRPPLWSKPLSPYLGPSPTEASIRSALEGASPWLDVESVPSRSRRHSIIAEELSNSGVVALYRGRSELGPRALGHRSILADPRQKGLVRFINEKVKLRESFRPFAPSALSEHAPDWFDLGDPLMDSPYMSLTAKVKDDKMGRIPAVTHVDGSSRLQTVTEESEPSYHALIRAFFDLTGVPLVLNTSFNTLPGEPIVESPSDAVRSFLSSMGSIEMLVMGDYVVRRKDADVRSLLGKVTGDGTVVTPPLRPIRAGPFEMETKTVVGDSADDVTATTRVRMPSRAMHDDRPGRGWFDLLDDLEVQVLAMCDGENDVQDMLAEYLDDPDDEDEGGGSSVGGETETQDEQYQANVFSNIMRRLTRLYEYGFISW